MRAGVTRPAHAVRLRSDHQDPTASVAADLDDLARREVRAATNTLEGGDEGSFGIGTVGSPPRSHGRLQLVFGEQIRGVLVDQPGGDSRPSHPLWSGSRSVVPALEPDLFGNDVKEAEGLPQLGDLVLG
jgi:hypothetical protein